MAKREGDAGTWSHCGRRTQHAAHTHSFAMNEGRYDNILCNGWQPEDERITAWERIATHPFFSECFTSQKPLEAMIAKLDETHKYLTDIDDVNQLYPTPEENFWDDRTTPHAYSRQDSERDMNALLMNCEVCGDGAALNTEIGLRCAQHIGYAPADD